MGRPWPELERSACEHWAVAPGSSSYIPPARFLPGQLDRIRGVEFAPLDDVVHHLRGDYEGKHEPTLAFRCRDADLVDGVLYGRDGIKHLRQRVPHLPVYSRPVEVASGALYESWTGNRWFGNWLSDDCLAYPLAARFGRPIASTVQVQPHVPRYEALAGHAPRRIERVHFDEVILFADGTHNSDKKARATAFRAQLTATIRYTAHPGVFMTRGTSGDRRVLVNEADIAERLHRDLGFIILDPAKASVDEIVRACAGARVVVGTEGSHLVHGLVAMPASSALLVIQPPYRVVSSLKLLTDRQDQQFAFVVGTGGRTEFTVGWDDLRRTFDLLDG